MKIFTCQPTILTVHTFIYQPDSALAQPTSFISDLHKDTNNNTFKMGRAPLSKQQKEANRREQVKKYSRKADVRARMRRYEEVWRRDLNVNRVISAST